VRNKVYTCIVSLRPANLVYYQSRSPAELLKSSGLTQVSPSVLVELVIFLHIPVFVPLPSSFGWRHYVLALHCSSICGYVHTDMPRQRHFPTGFDSS